ncbi:MAG TPA: winged helix-turn-helix transcriptional regulator [Jatrophihabitans sp.]|nr:winged helix-turn-helix transcriptional regulator [Jatrophihabitans sp.]
MTRLRSYGQYCGVAHALELVGERWALLIVRDLILGPKRFTDLRLGLPRIPTNVLTTRLKELEESGVVRRRALPRPAASVVYELTDYGLQLEDIVLRLGAWGVQTMGDPKPEDILTADGAVLALRTAVHRELLDSSERIGYQLRVGEVLVYALLSDGDLQAGAGALADPDLVITMADFGTFKPLLTRQLNPAGAVADGTLELVGDFALLPRFIDVFCVTDPRPALV